MNISTPTVLPRNIVATPATDSPSVAIVLPFDPKMTPRTKMEESLKNLLEHVEQQILVAHPSELALPVIRKFQRLVRSLNFGTHHNSIALFVSDSIESLLYGHRGERKNYNRQTFSRQRPGYLLPK